jgi:hypothetical protein
MTLQVPDGSPWWLRLAADALLFFHVAGGAVGLLSGALALGARKGGRIHGIAGIAFVVSMTIMAAIGAAVSPFLPITMAVRSDPGTAAADAVLVDLDPNQEGRFRDAHNLT